jgi:hypothetical protein
MSEFYTVETIRTQVTVRPRAGDIYKFVGESLVNEGPDSARRDPFMVVRVVARGAFKFHSKTLSLGWTPVEGESKGVVFRFHELEEIELVERKSSL